MTISKDELLARKTELTTNAETIQADIVKSENQTKSLRNNLNAMAGALQQVEMFLISHFQSIQKNMQKENLKVG